MCHLFVSCLFIHYDWSICHIDAINTTIPHPHRLHPQARHLVTHVDLLFVVTIAKQTVTGDPWLLTQQAAQLWHKHSTGPGYIDPDQCISAMSWAALWLVTLQNTGLLLADDHGSLGDGDFAYYCTLELLPLARANYQPLVGQGWVMLASDWLVLAWGPSLIGHYVLITSHGTR